ncbi:phospholipid-translocating P-type ATPase [Gloeophyllum trabeum ATCC 11539]|uniref:Phospholipid-transporting ATPase n=1 Tax=Gloeophyllum trabeum (strain ATCC 11539 / FP-39264 / Madison 617) TaxID=670483 RepID=S7RT77_GLOTA|nr:phospholipid-translocating P-type ATPase [Gloeophyllum trabeum ATCC 11539]EPQ57895.1 phospholipid-translocating P-type ATPase [Gloeophyllum trabeum ATCC 11539]
MYVVQSYATEFFSIFSTISPGLVILPLLVVLGITALKDGYEDIKRHQSDRRVNYTEVRVLSGGGWSNPNASAGKEKTFVRGILPRSRRNRKVKQGGEAQNADTENLENAAPSEAIQAQTQTTDMNEPDVEYDDDESVRTGETGHSHHLFGHHHSNRPHWRNTIWEDVRVGDIVKLKGDESFPADILICATSDEENVCYVETKNLDGETNLKSRNAVPALTHMRTAQACVSKENAFHVECDRPDVNMYKFNAAVATKQGKFPVDMQNVLLRGTVLRNTEWVVGIVLFTGTDTKIVLNSGGAPSKRSKVERQMNPQVFINLIILAVMAVVCGIVDAVLEQRYYPLNAPWLYGDTQPDDNPRINGLVTWAFALITFQNIVPISLYISIEFVRTCQAIFIYFDKEIYYEKTKTPTLARSWNLSDDLGQIEYIFSDKTGTLTQNAMVFRQCSVNGKVYKGDESSEEDKDSITRVKSVADNYNNGRLASPTSEGSGTKQDGQDDHSVPSTLDAKGVKLSSQVLTHFQDSVLKQDLDQAIHAAPDSESAPLARSLNGFFSVLALCHTVLTAEDQETGAIEYKAQSPDEAALVQAAADIGFVFRGRDREILRLQTPFSDHVEKYELLNILDFTSARKRMSVVVRKLDDEDQRVFLLTKGADNVIFERLKPGNDDLKKTTEQHLDQFASEGLRTLTLAYKVISDEEYEPWARRYQEATVAMEDREGAIEAVCEELEYDLRLLGATAIEDRLQDGVPETIADLKRAGIKVWVATGDKLETAIAIGYSTNLIARDSNIIIVRGGDKSVYQQMLNAFEQFFPEHDILDDEHMVNYTCSPSRDGMYPLQRVNTGVSSLVGHDNGQRPGGFVLVVDGAALLQAFADVEHKTMLLKLAMQCEGVICCRVSPLQKALVVRLVKDGLGAMTLAIGDGANDVSMIQAADVGVGISGEEGLQAVNSSDYAIAQFRFLKRLLLVHGHWSYARNGNMIVNFFYKNLLCIGVLWWFQIYCAWSSQYAFEYTYVLWWNSFFTIAPVIAIGLFDRIVDDHVLMALPELYHYGREEYWFGTKLFLLYLLDAVVQSAIIFFLILYGYNTTTARGDGYEVAQYEFATVMAVAAVTTANLFNGLNTGVWTGWVFFAVALGIVLVWAYTGIYSIISPGWFSVPVYGNDHYLFHSALFWFGVLLTVLLSLAPRYVAKAYKFGFNPDDVSIMRWALKNDPHLDLEAIHRSYGLGSMRRPVSRASSMSNLSVRPPPSVDARGSRTDMSTGMRSTHRGFDFATEERGVAIRRMQSNLSERRQSQVFSSKRKRAGSLVSTLRRGLRKKPTTPTKNEKPRTPPHDEKP